ncbi:RluA family pseudouridine synthase [Paraglaciecola sp.]|uniref:RluA family pseudouridine synthase n=1 Tax=Paraglaciecola sp. TaxID=1920173 RepID=UPI003EF5C02E
MNSPIQDDFVVPVCAEQIEILFEDEHILVINKPSKLLSLSGKNPLNKDSVHFRLVQTYPEITLAHRLDFGTSGALLLAKNKGINAQLTKQFQNRTITKRYEAILDGHVTHDEGVIDFPISKDKANFPRLKICQQTGKSAQTQYRVLERLHEPNRTRVSFTPITGRTHQLRIHSQAIQHPILGCDLYGTETTLSKASRLLLHAVALEFEHPVSLKPMQITSPCPFLF